MKREGWGGSTPPAKPIGWGGKLYMSGAICSIFAVFLTGCATAPSEPRIITKEVTIEVPVKCRPTITRPDLPDIETAIAAGDDFGLAQAYRAFWLRARPYIAQLEAAVKGCAG